MRNGSLPRLNLAITTEPRTHHLRGSATLVELGRWEARRKYTKRVADASVAYTLYDESDLSYLGLAREWDTLYDAQTIGKESTTVVIRLL
jgi:hypothetical protein